MQGSSIQRGSPGSRLLTKPPLGALAVPGALLLLPKSGRRGACRFRCLPAAPRPRQQERLPVQLAFSVFERGGFAYLDLSAEFLGQGLWPPRFLASLPFSCGSRAFLWRYVKGTRSEARRP